MHFQFETLNQSRYARNGYTSYRPVDHQLFPGSAKINARNVARDCKLFLLFKLYMLKKIKRILLKMRPNDINAMDGQPALIVPLCR